MLKSRVLGGCLAVALSLTLRSVVGAQERRDAEALLARARMHELVEMNTAPAAG